MRRPGERRLVYLERHTFELLIAVLSVIAATSFLVDPETLRQTAVGRELAGWDVIWNSAYGLAGLAIIVGLAWPKPRVEAAGLILLATSVAINLIAIWQVVGSVGAAAIATYLAVVLACIGRVRQMFRMSGDAG